MVRDDYRLEEFSVPLLILAALTGVSLLGLPRIEHARTWQPTSATITAAPTQCAFVSSLILSSRRAHNKDFVGSCVDDADRAVARRAVPLYPIAYQAGGAAWHAVLSGDHVSSGAEAPGSRVPILVDPEDASGIDGPISLWADWHWLLALPAAVIQFLVLVAMACGIAPWRSLAALAAGG